MKRLIIFIVCALLLNQLAAAQDSLPAKLIAFSTKVRTVNAHISIGYLNAITDSGLFLSTEKQPVRFYVAGETAAKMFAFKELEKVRIAKKGIVGQSTLIGTVTGVVIGAILGFAQGDDPQSYWFRTTAGEKAFAGGVFFGAVGSLTGLIIGMVSHKTFVIHGKRENYEKMREKMRMKLGL